MWSERLPKTYEMFVRDGGVPDLFESLIQDWVDAGGDPEEAAVRYFLGTGRLRNTPERYSLMAEKGKSMFEEIKQMGLRLAQPPLP